MGPNVRNVGAQAGRASPNVLEVVLDDGSTCLCPLTSIGSQANADLAESQRSEPVVVNGANGKEPAIQIPRHQQLQTYKLPLDAGTATQVQSRGDNTKSNVTNSPHLLQSTNNECNVPSLLVNPPQASPSGRTGCSREDSRPVTLSPFPEMNPQEESNEFLTVCAPVEPGGTAGTGEPPNHFGAGADMHGFGDCCGNLVEEVTRISQRMDHVEHKMAQAVERSSLNPSCGDANSQGPCKSAHHAHEPVFAVAQALKHEREVTISVTLKLHSGSKSGSLGSGRGTTKQATLPCKEIGSDSPPSSCSQKLGSGTCRSDKNSFSGSATAAQDRYLEPVNAKEEARNTWKTVFQELSILRRCNPAAPSSEKCLPEIPVDAVAQRMAQYDDALRVMAANHNTDTDAACILIAQLGRELLGALQEVS